MTMQITVDEESEYWQLAADHDNEALCWTGSGRYEGQDETQSAAELVASAGDNEALCWTGSGRYEGQDETQSAAELVASAGDLYWLRVPKLRYVFISSCRVEHSCQCIEESVKLPCWKPR